jgi:hypothetical protein
MKPLATKQYRWAPNDPDNWGYVLWKDYLVYPIINEAGIAEIDFPAGSNWIYHFNHTKMFKGNTKIVVMFPLN